MTIGFQRPIGASADVRELEYISALCQTDMSGIRTNGSINDEDIVFFLLSRYGIEVTVEDVRTKVIRGLGGGDEVADSCLDLMEIVAILLIPTLLKAASPEKIPDNLINPKEGLIQFVWKIMLHDTTGTSEPKPLTKKLIQRILISYGESELASNDQLVNEMFDSAVTDDGELTLEAFTNALTDDIGLYDIRSEARRTTNYDDVFLTRNHHEKWHPDDEESGDLNIATRQERKSMSVKLKRRFTAAPIDFVAGTYRSKTLTVTLLATFILVFFGPLRSSSFVNPQLCSDSDQTTNFVYGASWPENANSLACTSANSVAKWLEIFFLISLIGLIVVGLGSIGNDISCRRFYLPLIGMFFVGVLATPQLKANNSADNYVTVMALCLGSVAMLMHLSHAVILLIPKRWWKGKFPRLEAFMGSDGMTNIVIVKRAAAFKVNLLTENALSLIVPEGSDVVLESYYGQGILAFSKYGKSYEDIGFVGLLERIYNRAFDKEGIFISARLLSANISQYIVAIFILIAGIQLTKTVVQEYSKNEGKAQAIAYIDMLFNNTVDEDLVRTAVANLSLVFSGFLAQQSNQAFFAQNCPSANLTGSPEEACTFVNGFYLCNNETLSLNNSSALCSLVGYSSNSSSADGLLQLGLLDASGLNTESILGIAREATNAAAQGAIDSLYPAEQYMITIPLVIGTIAAFLTALSLAVTYLPSATATTLKLRSGVIPTFRAPKDFQLYRYATDEVTALTGGMFWGCFIASVLVGALIAAVIFMFLWQATVALVQKFVAIAIGFLVVLIVKLIIILSLRCTFYQAFYRRRPAGANIAALAFECANFALSVGFVFLRMVRFLVMGAVFVGRIDTPFLAADVGRLGNFELDKYPRIFMKDILAQEAHRHPYINLLGVMYLMKLRYGEHFGRRAGSTWRLIFVHALMPWLNKYRVLTRTTNARENLSSRGIVFQSLRKVLEEKTDDKDDMDSIPIPLSAALIRHSSMKQQRSNRASLLAKEIGEERLIEVEEENASLKMELNDLESEVQRLTMLFNSKGESS